MTERESKRVRASFSEGDKLHCLYFKNWWGRGNRKEATRREIGGGGVGGLKGVLQGLPFGLLKGQIS